MFKSVVCGVFALYGSRWFINQGTKHFSTLLDLENQYDLECSRQSWALERYLTASAPFSSNATENEYLPIINLPTAYIGSRVLKDKSFEILQLEKDEALGSHALRTADTRKALEDLAGKCSKLRSTIEDQVTYFSGYFFAGLILLTWGTVTLFGPSVNS